MTELTVRFRSPRGQHNERFRADERVTALLQRAAAHYGLGAQAVAARLYTDPGCERRLIAAGFPFDAQVGAFIKANGQIVYVRLDGAERPPGAAAPRVAPGTPLEELEAVIARPRELAPGCAHPEGVHCLRCLRAWEQKVLRAAGVSQLEWDRHRLASQASAGRVQTIRDVRQATMTQVVLRHQEEFRFKTLHIDQVALEALQRHLRARNYLEECMFYVYGAGCEAQLLDPVPYVTVLGAQVIPERSWEHQAAKRALIERKFGLELLGCGFCTRNPQFSKTQLLRALQCGGDLVLHVQLVDVEHYSAQRHEAALRQKFEAVGRRTVTMTVGAPQRPNGYRLEAYGLSDQIQFLYRNGAVAETQDGPSEYELKFTQKQIINEQFMECVDTDCFLVNMGVAQGRHMPASGARGVVPWQEVFEQLAAKEPAGDALVGMVTRYSGSVLRDPGFLLLAQLAGVDVAGDARAAVAAWLKE